MFIEKKKEHSCYEPECKVPYCTLTVYSLHLWYFAKLQ